MSTNATLTLETFPNQQEIIQFFNNHPMKSSLEDPFIEHASGPESIQKVANYFAGKQMHRSEVKTHVVTVLAGPEKNSQIMAKLNARTESKLSMLAEVENPSTQIQEYRKSLNEVRAKTTTSDPTFFDLAVESHASILCALLDNAKRATTNAGDTLSQRNVQDLTLNQ